MEDVHRISCAGDACGGPRQLRRGGGALCIRPGTPTVGPGAERTPPAAGRASRTRPRPRASWMSLLGGACGAQETAEAYPVLDLAADAPRFYQWCVGCLRRGEEAMESAGRGGCGDGARRCVEDWQDTDGRWARMMPLRAMGCDWRWRREDEADLHRMCAPLPPPPSPLVLIGHAASLTLYYSDTPSPAPRTNRTRRVPLAGVRPLGWRRCSTTPASSPSSATRASSAARAPSRLSTSGVPRLPPSRARAPPRACPRAPPPRPAHG